MQNKRFTLETAIFDITIRLLETRGQAVKRINADFTAGDNEKIAKDPHSNDIITKGLFNV